MYRQEETLVNDFISNLPKSSFFKTGKVRIAREFDYNRGRVDIVLLTENKEIIAFEAKLERWREALHQAYRNTCFAHYSYIILPEDVANRAIQYEMEFSNRSVGICYLSNSQIVIAQMANRADPFQAWLTYKARAFFEEGENGSIN